VCNLAQPHLFLWVSPFIPYSSQCPRFTILTTEAPPNVLTVARHDVLPGGGSPEVIKLATEQNHGLGTFIRSLVGLDRETAKQAFSQFVSGTTATANQLEFIDLIVQYLTENGVMEADRLYESPFTDISQQGPDALFLPSREMVRVLGEIRERARA
jgi:type I restriction enzyme R subunit